MFSTLGLILATVSVSSAHFILHWPPTAGFIDDTESTGPCGGATVSVNSSSPQVQVEQFAVQIESTHPEGQWMFRGTLSTEEPYNWTDIVPVVNTTGLGEFCLPSLRVPSEWAGSAGILQVIDNSPDGTLYQVGVFHKPSFLDADDIYSVLRSTSLLERIAPSGVLVQMRLASLRSGRRHRQNRTAAPRDHQVAA